MCSNLAKGVELAHKAQLAALANEKRLAEFKSLDPSIISDLTDIDLAAWQHSFGPDSPQNLLAVYEWQRRLVSTQVKAANRAAWIGVIAVIVGTFLGWGLASLKPPENGKPIIIENKSTPNPK